MGYLVKEIAHNSLCLTVIYLLYLAVVASVDAVFLIYGVEHLIKLLLGLADATCILTLDDVHKTVRIGIFMPCNPDGIKVFKDF